MRKEIEFHSGAIIARSAAAAREIEKHLKPLRPLTSEEVEKQKEELKRKGKKYKYREPIYWGVEGQLPTDVGDDKTEPPPPVSEITISSEAITKNDNAVMKKIAETACNIQPLESYHPTIYEVEVRKLFWGKRVAVVGNATPEKDLSAEIDSCDVVVRFNNFYNYASGKVGKRLDMLCITPSGAWGARDNDEVRGKPVIKALKPVIYIVRHEERARWRLFKEYFDGLLLVKERPLKKPQKYYEFTTGGHFLAHCLETCENCEIRVFGFGGGEELIDYLKDDGKHYLYGQGFFREYLFRKHAMPLLNDFVIYTQDKIEEVHPCEAFAARHNRELMFSLTRTRKAYEQERKNVWL